MLFFLFVFFTVPEAWPPNTVTHESSFMSYTPSQVGVGAIFQCLWSLIWRKRVGSVRVHFAQPFSLKVHSSLNLVWLQK